jgi:radical SAM protein with 4Fe4S-binding SPASM domain
VDEKMALNVYESMKFFRRYKDPQRIDCNDISLKIRLTNRCNYKCHYCPYKDNSESFTEWNQLKLILRFIDQLDKDYFYIYLHGGEPTIHPNFVEFVHALNDLLVKKNIDYFIYFDTNFNMSLSKLYKLFDNVDTTKFKINCTYHIKQCKEFNIFLDKYLVLNHYKLHKQLNMMFEYDYYNELRKMCYQLVDFGHVNIVPKPIIYDKNELQYSDKQKEFFYLNDPRRFYYVDKEDNEHIFSLNQIELENLNNFLFLKCDYGYKNIVIDVDGSIYYCTSHQLGRARNDMKTVGSKPIMNIFKDDLNIYHNAFKPSRCIYTKCSACDLRVLKRGSSF